eukprot:8197396-Ditylum_brightwellii.AAC.1
MEVAAQRLLDPDTKEIDVLLLDSMVAAAYDLLSLYRSAANKVLMVLQEALNFGQWWVLYWRGSKICRVDSLGAMAAPLTII